MRTLSGVMAAWEAKYREPGYLFPYDPLVRDKLLAGHGAGSCLGALYDPL